MVEIYFYLYDLYKTDSRHLNFQIKNSITKHSSKLNQSFNTTL